MIYTFTARKTKQTNSAVRASLLSCDDAHDVTRLHSSLAAVAVYTRSHTQARHYLNQYLFKQELKAKILSEPQGPPYGGADLRFCSPQSDMTRFSCYAGKRQTSSDQNSGFQILQT